MMAGRLRWQVQPPYACCGFRQQSPSHQPVRREPIHHITRFWRVSAARQWDKESAP